MYMVFLLHCNKSCFIHYFNIDLEFAINDYTMTNDKK